MATWTPIRYTSLTEDGSVMNKYYAGIIIQTNGTASTTHVRESTAGGNMIATYVIEAVTGGTTRAFPNPGLVLVNSGIIFVDMDPNVTRVTVLHG